ncbi:hypothetical protein PI126_g16078 [Phytophthora idaei]|nr:hypothetical protein PI126_g16078 [Phytophthora idaei]
MKKDAEELKNITLEEMCTLLGLPKDTLANTREAAFVELSTPEYWLTWYQKTLAASEKDIGAIRDFGRVRSGRKDGTQQT